MAIPEDLASALDHLRIAIQAANEEMLKTPGSDAASVQVEDLNTDTLQAFLELAEVDGSVQICLAIDSSDLQKPAKFTPVQDLPVNERIKAAVQIPALIEAAKSKCEALAPDVEEIACEIEQTIAKYRPTAGKAKGKSPRRSK